MTLSDYCPVQKKTAQRWSIHQTKPHLEHLSLCCNKCKFHKKWCELCYNCFNLL